MRDGGDSLAGYARNAHAAARRMGAKHVRGNIKTIDKQSIKVGPIMSKILFCTAFLLGATSHTGSASIAAGADADPVVGTWKLNVAKSKVAVWARQKRAKRASTLRPPRA